MIYCPLDVNWKMYCMQYYCMGIERDLSVLFHSVEIVFGEKNVKNDYSVRILRVYI